MSIDGSEQTVLEQFGPKRLYPHSRLFSDEGQRAACAIRPVIIPAEYASRVVDPLPGCCEFATVLIFQGSENRACSETGCFCPATVFKDPKVFDLCQTRVDSLEKLKELPVEG